MKLSDSISPSQPVQGEARPAGLRRARRYQITTPNEIAPAITKARTRRPTNTSHARSKNGSSGTARGRRPRPSVELPVTRRGRAVCDVSHVWHAPRACHGHSHERPRHTGVTPLISGVILGLCVDILWPRRIVLEGWNRPNAVSVCAEAVDHGLPVLTDKAGAQLIPASHRSALGHARI